jgi:hypothetical protein
MTKDPPKSTTPITAVDEALIITKLHPSNGSIYAHRRIDQEHALRERDRLTAKREKRNDEKGGIFRVGSRGAISDGVAFSFRD